MVMKHRCIIRIKNKENYSETQDRYKHLSSRNLLGKGGFSLIYSNGFLYYELLEHKQSASVQ